MSLPRHRTIVNLARPTILPNRSKSLIYPPKKRFASSVEDRVKRIIAELLEVKLAKYYIHVKQTGSFVKDLGAKDGDVKELMMALEEEFDVEIPDAEAEKINTVQKAIDYVKSHGKV